MNKALKRYKGKKWRDCGFKPYNIAAVDFSTWLYWQPERYINDVLGCKRAKLFISSGLSTNDLIKGARK